MTETMGNKHHRLSFAYTEEFVEELQLSFGVKCGAWFIDGHELNVS
jgi:hypothetical protein